ncbi:MAG: DUF1549 domain-containing protein [Pirellulaceae bacterium]
MNALLVVALLSAAPVDFDTEVLPVLTRAGCNSGACHGAAAGRGGFRLSLFGGDPQADHRAIVHELEGRRVNLARPDRSLLLLKPTWEIDHEGGQRFEADSPFAQLLTEWIGGGALRTPARQLTELIVEPKQATVAAVPAEVKLAVTARFDDGTSRRVEDLAVFTPADPASTKVDPGGNVQVLRPGRQTIVVRFLTHVAAIQITAPYPGESLDLSARPRGNWIDDEIYAAHEGLRLPPSPRAGDATLLRRVTLDLTGRLPTPSEVRAYLADRGEDKFVAAVDRLLASSAFNEYWTYQYARWQRIRTNPNDAAGTRLFRDWLHGQIAAARPLDEWTAELLTAEGDSHTVGPANFHRNAADARGAAEYLSESLLGIRLRCANCHNHPLDQWTQDDYHGLAAIFARLERGTVVRLKPTGEVVHPATGEAAIPRLPGARFLPADQDNRPALAAWLVSGEHGRLARAQVNRLWHSLLGRGLIEPIDDLRETNPASHPALLDRLTADFIQHGYDLRHTLGLIANSAAYQRSGQPLPAAGSDERFYSHARPRALAAEVLLDAVCDATGVGVAWDDAPPADRRAIQAFSPELLAKELGPLASCIDPRGCQQQEEQGASLDQLAVQLHWINGKLVNRRLENVENLLAGLAAETSSPEKLVEEYYLRTLSRLPTADELAFWSAELSAGSRAEKCRDLAWSLLSCREFVTNH